MTWCWWCDITWRCSVNMPLRLPRRNFDVTWHDTAVWTCFIIPRKDFEVTRLDVMRREGVVEINPGTIDETKQKTTFCRTFSFTLSLIQEIFLVKTSRRNKHARNRPLMRRAIDCQIFVQMLRYFGMVFVYDQQCRFYRRLIVLFSDILLLCHVLFITINLEYYY